MACIMFVLTSARAYVREQKSEEPHEREHVSTWAN
jgi:hypothetical protein